MTSPNNGKRTREKSSLSTRYRRTSTTFQHFKSNFS
jgi:hypothetical protein